MQPDASVMSTVPWLTRLRLARDAATAALAIGAAKRDESLDATEHAALAAVCLAIMNLDEALTRE